MNLDELRPVSFAIAYRMLGSVAEAEDIVQEALLAIDERRPGALLFDREKRLLGVWPRADTSKRSTRSSTPRSSTIWGRFRAGEVR